MGWNAWKIFRAMVAPNFEVLVNLPKDKCLTQHDEQLLCINIDKLKEEDETTLFYKKYLFEICPYPSR